MYTNAQKKLNDVTVLLTEHNVNIDDIFLQLTNWANKKKTTANDKLRRQTM